MTPLPDHFVHMLPAPAGAGATRVAGPRSLLQYDVTTERLGALVVERHLDVASARHAVALAFILAGRLPRHLEFGRRATTDIALDPRSPDVLSDLGLRADTAADALAALTSTGIVWPDSTGRVTLAADVLAPLATEAAERRALPNLLDVGELSACLDAVIPMTTRGSRERKSGAWFVLSAIAAAAAQREWVALAAGAFRAPLSFEAGGVTKAISSCVAAGILERHQRPGETAQYRFAPAGAHVAPLSQRATARDPMRSAVATPSSTPDAQTSPACIVEINGATLTLARGAELTVDAGMRCRVTRDPMTGGTRVIVE